MFLEQYILGPFPFVYMLIIPLNPLKEIWQIQDIPIYEHT